MRTNLLMRLGQLKHYSPAAGGPTTITLSLLTEPTGDFWGADVNDNGSKFPADASDYCGGDSVDSSRVANKFDITTLPAAATVTLVELLINVASVTGGGALLWDIDGYNGTGLGDPEADAGLTMYASCAIAGVYVNDTTEFRTTGLKTIDLGATARSDLEAARDAGTIFSVAIRETTDTTGDNRCEFTEYPDGTNPPKLRITYT